MSLEKPKPRRVYVSIIGEGGEKGKYRHLTVYELTVDQVHDRIAELFTDEK